MGSLPTLIKFYEEHAADRKRFEILAFHDEAAKSFAELDPKLADLKEKAWGGKDLPFPILLDASGKTVRDFGIHAFPTTILIDPAGNLVKYGSEGMLAVRLGEERPGAVERARKLSAAPGGKKEVLPLLAAMGTADGEDGAYGLSLYLQGCKDPECADAALDALGRIGGTAATGLLFEHGVGAEDARRQVRAAGLLGPMVPADRLFDLLNVLDGPGAGLPLARAVCGALAARAAEKEDLPKALLGMTRSVNSAVRVAAAEAVAACGAEGAVTRLIALLAEDASEDVRLAAIRGLVALKDPLAGAAFRAAGEKDRSFTVRNAAKAALEEMGAK